MSSIEDGKHHPSPTAAFAGCTVATSRHSCICAASSSASKRRRATVTCSPIDTSRFVQPDFRLPQLRLQNARNGNANRGLAGDKPTRSQAASPAWRLGSTFFCASKSLWWLRAKIHCKSSTPGTTPAARLVPCVRHGASSRRKRNCATFPGSIPPAVRYDQYYTQEQVARALYAEVVRRYDPDLFQMLEPSAGEGAFFRLMPSGSLGIDIDPKCPGIVQADFLERRVESGRRVATIGNPPFGKNASMAVDFFNHAATMSDVIAFVLPRTFRKRQLQNRLHRNFHLVHDQDVPADAFRFMGKPYNVPAVFQIWERRECERALHVTENSHPDFAFTTPDEADFAIQRVGANAGRIHHDFQRSANAHFFVRVEGRSAKASERVQSIMQMLDFRGAAGNVAGNPSLAKSEIVALYQAFITGQLLRKASHRIALRKRRLPHE